MRKYKKEILISGAFLITIIFIVGLFFIFRKNKAEAPAIERESNLIYIGDKQPEKVVYTKKETIPTPPPVVIIDELNNISYTEAVMKYRDGRHIQFSENCQSVPYRMVIVNGAELMLDNRSPNKEIISIGDMKYFLDPYGFKIIKLNETQIPTTHLIDCAVSQNVNTLIVE